MTPDLQLLVSIRAGDQRAFASFHDEIKPYLLSVAIRRLRSMEDSEEIVERALVQFWRGAANFRGECAVKSFLTRIVINLCLNRYQYDRRRKKDAMRSFDSPLDDETEATLQDVIPDPNADTTAVIERGELEINIERAMDRLSPEKSEILHLVAIKGKTYEEVAVVFGIKVGTVKSRVARARGDLRVFLAA